MESDSDSGIFWGVSLKCKRVDDLRSWAEKLSTVQLPAITETPLIVKEDDRVEKKSAIKSNGIETTNIETIIDLTIPTSEENQSTVSEEPIERSMIVIEDDHVKENSEIKSNGVKGANIETIIDLTIPISEENQSTVSEEPVERSMIVIEDDHVEEKSEINKSNGVNDTNIETIIDLTTPPSGEKQPTISEEPIERSMIVIEDDHVEEKSGINKSNVANATNIETIIGLTTPPSEEKQSTISGEPIERSFNNLKLSSEVEMKSDALSNIEKIWNKITSIDGMRISYLSSPNFNDSVLYSPENQNAGLSKANQTPIKESIDTLVDDRAKSADLNNTNERSFHNLKLNSEVEMKSDALSNIEKIWNKITSIEGMSNSYLRSPNFDDTVLYSPENQNASSSKDNKILTRESIDALVDDKAKPADLNNTNERSFNGLKLSSEVDIKSDAVSNIEKKWKEILSIGGMRAKYLASPNVNNSVLISPENQNVRLPKDNKTPIKESIDTLVDDRAKSADLNNTNERLQINEESTKDNLQEDKLQEEKIQEEKLQAEKTQEEIEKVEAMVTATLNDITKALPAINCKDILHRQLSDIYSYKSNIPVYTPKNIQKKKVTEENRHTACFKTPLKQTPRMTKHLSKSSNYKNIESPIGLYVKKSIKPTFTEVKSISTPRGVLTPQNAKPRNLIPVSASTRTVSKLPKCVNLKPSNTVVIAKDAQKLPNSLKKFTPSSTVMKHQTNASGYSRTKFFNENDSISRFDQTVLGETNDTSLLIAKSAFK